MLWKSQHGETVGPSRLRSTGNEDPSFYGYNDSALCLTTNGIRQALMTGSILKKIDASWTKPGNFNIDICVSEYFRAAQTARIVLDEMGLLSATPKITPFLNERDYGTRYLPEMDKIATFDGNGSESGVHTRDRVKNFLRSLEPLLWRADLMLFSHFGAIRAIIAELTDLSDDAMMDIDVPNGKAFQFNRIVDVDGQSSFQEEALPLHVLDKAIPFIQPLPRAFI
ncbi:histidine phosphatase family protein [Paraburkholderia sp. BCC1885]|uniref:histidine phosphatase family protein n=1 Tax=Paraburkholderia sp. BCC1885 TaxID=2562669 RepID=UPI0011834BBE|nr:histidine phosphatase family protein [Paraburkholderia sp. BCC1885]